MQKFSSNYRQYAYFYISLNLGSKDIIVFYKTLESRTSHGELIAKSGDVTTRNWLTVNKV